MIYALLTAVVFILIFVYFYVTNGHAKNIDLSRELAEQTLAYKALKIDYEFLQKKFELNPSYETQLLLADLLSGSALVHIERIEPENVLIRRPK